MIPLGSLLAGFLLQAVSAATTMTVVAAGMAVTAAAATMLAPIRDAGRGNRRGDPRGDRPRPPASAGPASSSQEPPGSPAPA